MRFCISLVAIFAVMFIYVSCNKHTVPKSTGNINMTLSSWEHSSNPGFHTQLSFDEMHRIIKEETGSDISSYEFSTDSLTITELNKEENRYVYKFKGKLDNQKRLVSGVATSSYLPTAPDTVQHLFEYNKAGYLLTELRISSSSDTFRIKYEYEDNMVKKVSTYSDTILFNTKEFTYYDRELSCSLPQETKFRQNINNLVGRSEQHLVKQVISTGRKGKKKYILNYEYQVDKNGNATKVMTKSGKKTKTIVSYFYAHAADNSNTAVAAK
jgi:hypothetical protein